jgi:hypothetical protein
VGTQSQVREEEQFGSWKGACGPSRNQLPTGRCRLRDVVAGTTSNEQATGIGRDLCCQFLDLPAFLHCPEACVPALRLGKDFGACIRPADFGDNAHEKFLLEPIKSSCPVICNGSA